MSASRAILTRTCGALRRLAKADEGATAVEFGLIAVPFFAILFAILEVAYVGYENEMLAGATTRAARAMLTGQMQGANITSTSQFVSTYLCPTGSGRLLPSSFDCSKLIVDVRTATSFAASNLTKDLYKSASNQFCPGAPGQIVVMRVAYPLPSIFPISLFTPTAGVVSDVPGRSGNFHILLGEALFVEEQYAGSFTPAAGC